LLFGLIAGATFIAASTILGALLPNYDPVSQTISEIGERGSPFETIFKVVNLFEAGCLMLFAFGVYRFSEERGVSLIPAGFLAYKAALEVGVFVFEAPHPWHNLFGIGGIPGLLAPLALAITWPRAPDLPGLRPVSAIAGVLLIGAIGLNLVPLFVLEQDAPAWLREHYGLVQRTLFIFHFWCAYSALILFFYSARQPVQNRG
jgi:hypothetical membrane protein